MSNVTRIDYTLADGNTWTEEGDEYDMEASLDLLSQQIADALGKAYPAARVTVTRENVSGGVQELRAESDDEDGLVDDNTLDSIRCVADGVWETGGWYVKA